MGVGALLVGMGAPDVMVGRLMVGVRRVGVGAAVVGVASSGVGEGMVIRVGRGACVPSKEIEQLVNAANKPRLDRIRIVFFMISFRTDKLYHRLLAG